MTIFKYSEQLICFKYGVLNALHGQLGPKCPLRLIEAVTASLINKPITLWASGPPCQFPKIPCQPQVLLGPDLVCDRRERVSLASTICISRQKALGSFVPGSLSAIARVPF